MPVECSCEVAQSLVQLLNALSDSEAVFATKPTREALRAIEGDPDTCLTWFRNEIPEGPHGRPDVFTTEEVSMAVSAFILHANELRTRVKK